jgi:hypothetical protein
MNKSVNKRLRRSWAARAGRVGSVVVVIGVSGLRYPTDAHGE